MNNLKAFPVDYEKKSTSICEDLKTLLDDRIGPNKYVAYFTVASTDNVEGLSEKENAEFISYRFSLSPTGLPEKDTDILLSVLLENLAKDTSVSESVAKTYANKFIDIISTLINAEEHDEEGVN